MSSAFHQSRSSSRPGPRKFPSPRRPRLIKKEQNQPVMGAKMSVVLPLILFFLAANVSAAAAPAPEGFGRNLNEIVARAKKEGKVRFTSGTPDERQAKEFFKSFRDKYPEIEVEYTRGTPRTASEKIFAELLSGQSEYDLLTVLDTLMPKYKKANLLAGPFDWKGLFGIREVYISPDRFFVGAGGSTDAIVYNTKMVPRERVPRNWEDCLDPYWKGRFIVDTRAGSFVRLYPLWGKEKLLDFARRLVANKPIW